MRKRRGPHKAKPAPPPKPKRDGFDAWRIERDPPAVRAARAEALLTLELEQAQQETVAKQQRSASNRRVARLVTGGKKVPRKHPMRPPHDKLP